jgi:hypothetical protein
MRLGTSCLVLCALMGATGVPALAQTAPDPSAAAATAAPASAAPAPSGNDRIICRETPPVAGSHLGSQKVCGTLAQWNASYFRGHPANESDGIYIPGNATAGGMAPPTATPHGGGGGRGP